MIYKYIEKKRILYCPVSVSSYLMKITIPTVENVEGRQGGSIIDFHHIIDGYIISLYYYILYCIYLTLSSVWCMVGKVEPLVASQQYRAPSPPGWYH